MKYTAGLNKKDMQRLQNSLKTYSNNLQAKCREFIERLGQLGLEVAKAHLSTGARDDDFPDNCSLAVNIDNEGNPTKGVLVITSDPHVTKDGRVFYPHLALEFGVGNKHNKSAPQRAGEFGMGPGTFPKQTHIPEPGYWYYRGEQHFGVEATMPMFEASQEMMKSINEVAKEVFGNV